MFYLTANFREWRSLCHFKKYCLPAFWHLPDFLYPQAIYAAPDAKTETPVTYGWNSDALGRFFLTENGSVPQDFVALIRKYIILTRTAIFLRHPRKVSCTSPKNLIISLRTDL